MVLAVLSNLSDNMINLSYSLACKPENPSFCPEQREQKKVQRAGYHISKQDDTETLPASWGLFGDSSMNFLGFPQQSKL